MDFSIESELKTTKLLGKSVGLHAREMLYVYFDVKQCFGISIPVDAIEEGRFDTFAHIADIIECQLEGVSADVQKL